MRPPSTSRPSIFLICSSEKPDSLSKDSLGTIPLFINSSNFFPSKVNFCEVICCPPPQQPDLWLLVKNKNDNRRLYTRRSLLALWQEEDIPTSHHETDRTSQKRV